MFTEQKDEIEIKIITHHYYYWV